MDNNQIKVIQARMTSNDMALIGVCVTGLGYAIEAGKMTPEDLEMSPEDVKKLMSEMWILQTKIEFIMQGVEDELKACKEHPQDNA